GLEQWFPDGLFSALHEAGHGLYEQGLAGEHFGWPTGSACSLGVHESQSRMWENLVGRSRGFWQFFYPKAQAAFPGPLAGVSLDQFHRAINEVKASMIRVDADEVTYNLHVLLRFEIEQALLAETLDFKDVPEAWNTRFEEIFRVKPANDAEGCLQDIHWSAGLFGYFPTYTLGNVYAAQLFEQARTDLGDLEAQFAQGDFEPLRTWLNENVHWQGRRFPPRQLVERITGRPPAPEPLIESLESKYGAVYGL
ncbi:MAG: carboxypeptidase M32, partial [Planctomycetota bacterium]|nr:carboxypeptidase M32 [Planctomycetota bacterium]